MIKYRLSLLIKGILCWISLKLKCRLLPFLEKFEPAEIKGFAIMNEAMSVSAIMAARRLGLFSILNNETQSNETLSEKTQCHAPTLFRLLRALVAINVIKERYPDEFVATPLSNWLNEFLAIPLDSRGLKSWGYLYKSIQTGQPVWAEAYGEPLYDYLDHNPEASADFDRWNTQTAECCFPHIAARYDFKPFKKIVDIGGGQGLFITKILETNPHLQGVLFDRPEVVQKSYQGLQEKALSSRCEIEGGSFFESIPHGGDVYSFCRVLFNWGDDAVIAILKCCHKAMSKENKLIIIESLLPDSRHPVYSGAVLNDLNLLAHFGGKMRSVSDWEKLLAKANYSVTRVIHPLGFIGFSLIEAVAIAKLNSLSDKNIER